jgi:polyvinyl alcohol dehydrogenase (cytochrome)
MLTTLVLSSVLAAAPAAQAPQAGNQQAEAIYTARCAMCHESGVSRAANRQALSRLSVDLIRQALTSGSMRTQSTGLATTEIDSLARLLGTTTPASTSTAAATCSAAAPFTDPLDRPRWNGWGVTPAQHRFQPAAMAQLTARDVPRLKVKWAFGFPGVNRAFAQPTVVGGRVFVGSAGPVVYSLSAESGCQYWAFKPEAPVRTAVSVGAINTAGTRRWAAYFADQRATVYAVDALSGELIWKRRVDDFLGATITSSPTLAGDALYVGATSAEELLGAQPKYECCKFRGSVSALDAATGAVRWKSYTIPEEPKPVRRNKQDVQLWGPSGAGVWSSPAVDLQRGVVYATTGDSYSDPPASTSDSFVAFDLKTGTLLWWRQTTPNDAFNIACQLPAELATNCPQAKGPDFDFGSSPMLVDLPNKRRALIAGQKSGVVHAVDPDRGGEILWQTQIGKGSALGGVQWGTAFDGTRVYAALSDVQPEPAPPGAPGAQSSFLGGPALRLNPTAGGGLFAINPQNGDIVWKTPHPGCGDRAGCSPAQSAAVTAIPGIVFSGGLDGHLRAYSSDKGAIVWDADTARKFETVNGVAATGGSIDGPGPVVIGGMLFVNSGYAFIGGMPGNVLLAFSIDGR